MKILTALFSNIKENMNFSIINGVRYEGTNVTISGNKVIIDGKDVTPDAKEITIEIHGAVDRLKVDACQKVTVHGDVNKLETMSGDVHCNDVHGNVNTMSGDVNCGKIGGDVETMSGDVNTSTSIFGKAGGGGSGG